MMSDHTAVWKDTEAASVEFTPLSLTLLPHGFHFEVTRPDVVVGRHSEADIRLCHPDISRRHCRLVYTDGVWQVHDLRSLNGTFVNDQRLDEAVLFEGDRLRLGPWTLTVAEGQESKKSDGPQAEILKSILEAIPEHEQMRQAS